jgi:hypothetical protein
MSQPPKKYLQCACTHCGKAVDFPAYAVGGVTLCPHCGKSTVTFATAPVAAAPVAAQPAIAATPSNTKPSPTPAPAAKPIAKKKSPLAPVFFVLLLVAAVAGAGWFFSNSKPQLVSVKAAATNDTSAARPSVPAPAPVATATAKSPDDFKVGEIKIQRPKGTRGSRLVFATGSLTNSSAVLRLGVRIDLSLLNAQGTKIDDTSDYQASIGPGEVWNFHAVVHDPQAMTATIAKISEDN